MIKIKRLAVGLISLIPLYQSTLVSAQTLESYLEGDNFFISYEPADGFMPIPDFALTKIDDTRWQFASVGTRSMWKTTSSNFSASPGHIEFIIDANAQVTAVSYEILDYESEEFRAQWGDLVADQLIAANEQELISSSQFEVRSLVTKFEIDTLDETDRLYTGSTLHQAKQLVIDANITENLEGGWQGTTTPIAESEAIRYGYEYDMYTQSYELSNINARELFTGEWALPVNASVPYYTDNSDYIPPSQTTYDIFNLDDSSSQSLEFELDAEYHFTDTQLQIVYDDTIVTYQPIKVLSSQALLYVTVNSPDGNFSYMANAVKKDSSIEKFSRGLATHFPFIQIGLINGQQTHGYSENGLLKCYANWGYVFNRADFSINRGAGCSSGGTDERPDDYIVFPDTTDWVWNMNNAKLTMQYTGDYFDFRERYWEPLSTNEEGITVVFERSLATQIGGDFTGYFVAPRLNYIKLTDLSQYTEEYASGGFDGDNDGDGINDGSDTDDDNDGMPDIYEESYSLNHLFSADRDEDLDNDGLSNFEEFTLGTYPNDSDSDNDGILDGEDPSPLGLLKKATPLDYDGDGISDIVIRRPNAGQFIVARSSDNAIVRTSFGVHDSDIPLAGDFDGDGITDIAIRRPSIYQFITRSSSDDEINRIYFGAQDEDISVVADFDGDGKDDYAVRRPSTGQWFIKYTSTGEIVRRAFGLNASDIPAVADYDGDGKADIAVRRKDSGQFIILNSSTGDVSNVGFGSQSTDIPVPADYDGDGKADIAVRRPDSGYWFIKRSTDNVIERVYFGSEADDIPVVADYDGDGIIDIAIRRPSSGGWIAKLSSDNSYARFYFGSLTTDIPVAAPLETRMAMTGNAAADQTEETFSSFEPVHNMKLIKETLTPKDNWGSQLMEDFNQ